MPSWALVSPRPAQYPVDDGDHGEQPEPAGGGESRCSRRPASAAPRPPQHADQHADRRVRRPRRFRGREPRVRATATACPGRYGHQQHGRSARPPRRPRRARRSRGLRHPASGRSRALGGTGRPVAGARSRSRCAQTAPKTVEVAAIQVAQAGPPPRRSSHRRSRRRRPVDDAQPVAEAQLGGARAGSDADRGRDRSSPAPSGHAGERNVPWSARRVVAVRPGRPR